MKINYLLDNGATCPTKAHKTDAGFDLVTPRDFTVWRRDFASVDLGLHIEIPAGYYGQIAGRSGLASKGIFPIGGVIDSGYTGSIRVCLMNASEYTKHFKAGDRIAQLLILPVPDVEFEQAERLEDSERGENGFGSTGV